MARIQGVPQNQAGPMVKLVYRFMRRGMKKMTGREAAHGSGIEPVEIWAHQPKMMSGMGKFQQAVSKGKSVDERLKNLVELKGAQMIGCEFCVDLGSQICRKSGLTDEELLALPRYRQSELFTEREKSALDYTVAVMRTPVEVTDELFDRLTEHFGDGAAGGDHRAADGRQPRPVQRRLRDRVGRLLRGDGVRAAGSSEHREDAAGRRRIGVRTRIRTEASRIRVPDSGVRDTCGRQRRRSGGLVKSRLMAAGVVVAALGVSVAGTAAAADSKGCDSKRAQLRADRALIATDWATYRADVAAAEAAETTMKSARLAGADATVMATDAAQLEQARRTARAARETYRRALRAGRLAEREMTVCHVRKA